MNAATHRIGVAQNLGLADRIVRFVIGFGLMGVAAYDLYSGSMVSWHAYAIILAIYPCLTSIVGVDPVLAMLDARTCNLDEKGRNRCGTFPFEVAAALGKKVKCQDEFDCHIPNN